MQSSCISGWPKRKRLYGCLSFPRVLFLHHELLSLHDVETQKKQKAYEKPVEVVGKSIDLHSLPSCRQHDGTKEPTAHQATSELRVIWGFGGGIGRFRHLFWSENSKVSKQIVEDSNKDEGILIRTFEIGPSAPTRRTFRMLLLASSQFAHPKTYAIAMSCPPNPPNIIIPSSTIQGSFTYTVYYWPGIAPPHSLTLRAPRAPKAQPYPINGVPRVSRPRTSL